MKIRDVLFEVAQRQLAEEKVEEILDSILESDDAERVEVLLSLSRTEWTAYCHGATFAELAQWRYHGWPTRCAECGQQIAIENFGWKVIELAGVSKLKHIQCPIKSDEQ